MAASFFLITSQRPMPDKEHEIPVKVIDRRWWANQDRKPEAGDAATATSLKPTYVEELERQVAEKDKQLQEYIGKYRQAASEFEEARLRLRREISKDIERARRDILADILEVVDNLDRALEATRQGASPDTLIQGVELVQRQFLAKLESFGVRPIEAAPGRPFDPALHEAVSAVPVTDAGQDGQIIGVVRRGYRINDDVLRPAAVAVATPLVGPTKDPR
jgi:molecular chaperone GrpE